MKELEEFTRALRNQISDTTLKNYRNYLTYVFEGVGKQLSDISLNDVNDYFEKAKIYANSQEVYKCALRRFYTWLGKVEGKKYPILDDLHIIQKNMNKRENPVRPEGVLTKTDIITLIKAAENFRDQAIVAVLYESGARLSEFLGLNVGHIGFNKDGAVMMVSGKTGNRRILLIESVPYLQQWLTNHPLKDKPDAPLWTTKHNGEWRRMAKPSLAQLLTAIASKTDIKKRVNPHSFRHSRLTELAKTLTDAKQKIFAGWTGGSRMTGVYTHLSGADLDQDLKRAAGVKVEEKVEENPLKPKKCKRCETDNPGPAEFCVKCGLPFDETKIVELAQPGEIENLKTQIKNLETIFTTSLRLAHQQATGEKMTDAQVTELLQHLKTAKIEEK